MSKIDTSMDSVLRAVMLSEVRSLLPAFLSAAAVERGGPLSAAAELLNLPKSALHRVLAVHIMLSTPVRELVADLPTGVRRPLTASTRPRVAGRTVTSGIDWAATARHRATASPLGDIWVTRPANRIFDIPENRVLAWVLRTIEERGRLAVPSGSDKGGAWRDEIRTMTNAVHRARRTAWLEGVPSAWPGDDAYIRLRADRMGFYRTRVTNAARYLRHVLFEASPREIVEALSERYFEPSQDWKLFEIAVLMRITRTLSQIGKQGGPTGLFNDARRKPFASFLIDPGNEVRLWYQTWPPSSAPSELEDAVEHYELSTGWNRPDIVVELIAVDMPVRVIILELKASESSSYLSDGFSQLLGYLRDRPRLTAESASGWLVAPAGSSYKSKDPGGRALWVISADQVADAVKAAVLDVELAGSCENLLS